MGVHRTDDKKQNLAFVKKKSRNDRKNKNVSGKVYQWGYTGRVINNERNIS